jgi:hypothetical protein
MRILFIGSKKYDYLQDAVFSGLLKLIGWKNLHTFSIYKNYILPIKKYPRNIGYNKKSLLTNRLAFNCLNKYDFVILGSCKPDALNDYLSILPKVGHNTKTIFIDGGDTESIGGDFARLGGTKKQDQFEKLHFDFVFKREFLIENTFCKNIFPCPFAFNLDLIRNIPQSNYAYDVTFWAVESHAIRTEALNLLNDKFDCNENGTTTNQNFYKYKRTGKKYLEELKKAKITLNFRGGGWDTLRYWEVPAIGGFMVSQKPRIVIPNNFDHEKQIVFIKDDLSDLIEVCEYYLKNEKKREAIAKSAELHTKKFHTDIARANYILNIISRKN